jgi:hypothetical protein
MIATVFTRSSRMTSSADVAQNWNPYLFAKDLALIPFALATPMRSMPLVLVTADKNPPEANAPAPITPNRTRSLPLVGEAAVRVSILRCNGASVA